MNCENELSCSELSLQIERGGTTILRLHFPDHYGSVTVSHDANSTIRQRAVYRTFLLNFGTLAGRGGVSSTHNIQSMFFSVGRN